MMRDRIYDEDRLNIFLYVISLIILIRIFQIYSNEGWTDRGLFFNGAENAPGIFFFIVNEVFKPILLARIVLYGANLRYIIFFILSSIAFFTRQPLLEFVIAFLFAQNIKNKYKLFSVVTFVVLGFAVLYVRMGMSAFDVESIRIFWADYIFVGFARLVEISPIYNFDIIYLIGNILKPIDSVFFAVDYLFQMGGSLSIGRLIGYDLRESLYLTLLDAEYNAFGTVFYSWYYLYGLPVGAFFFLLSLIVNWYSYKIFGYSSSQSYRYIFFLIFSGFLFSHFVPFIWMAPVFLAIINFKSKKYLIRK